jgi:hypothetical protein
MSAQAIPAAPKLAWRRTRLGAAAWAFRAKKGAAREAAPTERRKERRGRAGKREDIGWGERKETG